MVDISFAPVQKYDLFLTGDFCPLSDTNNKSVQIDPDLMDTMSRARFRTVNLECPITAYKKPIAKSGPVLKGSTESIQILNALGVDLCNLANNHIMDYDYQGAADTVQALERNGMEFTGLCTPKGITPLIKEIGGRKVAFVSFTENEFSTLDHDGYHAEPLDYYKQMQQLQQAREQAEFVIVQYHGGAEMYPLPSPGQKRYAHYLVDIGASAVICHHSHCYSGYEVFHNAPIFYGLGNFYFPMPDQLMPFYKGLALCISFGPQLRVNIVTSKLELQTNTLALVPPSFQETEKNIGKYNDIIESDEKLVDAWRDFCAKNEYSSLAAVFNPSRLTGLLIKRGILKKHLAKKLKLGFMNRIRCETHREKLLFTMQKILIENDHAQY